MNDQPYRVERFRKALWHFLGGRAAQAAARAVLLLALVRLLPVEDYGAYMLVIGLAETLLQVASFGLLPVGQRYLPQLLTRLPINRLYRFVSTLVLAQAGLVAVVASCAWYYWPQLTPYMGMTSEQADATRAATGLFLLIPAFRFAVEMLDALLEQGKAQFARALMPVARVCGVLGLAALLTDFGVAEVLVVDLAVTALCLALAWWFLGRSLGVLHTGVTEGELPLREMLRFGWHMAATGLAGAALSPGALRLALASSLGIAESGLFAFLQSLQRLVSRYLPGTLLRGLVRPIFVSRTIGGDNTSVIEAGTGLLLKSNLLIVAAGIVFIAVAGDELVAWLSGNKFADAGLTLLLMFVALVVLSQRTVIEMVMQITGHTATLRATAFIAPFALAGVWYLAGYGLEIAVLIITLASALSNWIALGVLARSTRWFKVDWRAMVAVFLPVAASVAIGWLLAFRVWPPLAAVAAVAVFALLIRYSKPYRQVEVDIVGRALGQRFTRLMRGFAI